MTWDTQTAITAAAFAFVFGAVLGSFISVVAHRVPRGESVVGGRSKCPACEHQIAAYDNIPIVSWLLLRGRCRTCKERISVRYPLVEAGLGLAFAATVLVLHDDPTEMAMGMVLLTTLAAVTMTDLERRIIPNSILITAAVLGIAIAATDPSGFAQRIAGAGAAGGFFLLAALLYPRGMGMGDVKLAALIGFFLGRAVAPAILIALLAGAALGIAIIAVKGAAGRKQAVPFGPFLALGALVGLLVGNEMLDWYLDTFVSS
jgi:leader peptidase (prepilin peptidase)/N-methyltransferase